jgi:signal transduction histidine kinase
VRSIRTKIAMCFILVVIITVVMLELLIINMVRQNYFSNLENNLLNQVKISSELYSKYFSDSTLHDNVLNNVDTFWKQTSAQVEIVDTSGKVLMDSIGIIPSDDYVAEDVKKALKGEPGIWIGNVDYDDEKVMAVSYPLKSKNRIVGALRFITSIRELNKDIREIIKVFTYIGAVAVAISALISLILTNVIVGRPLKKVTAVAEEMASGNFSVRSKKRYNDEIGKLSDTLNYMADEILEKEQLKNEFISSVSHELRTPLTSIKGWAVTLKEESLQDNEILKDGLDIIEKESDRLTMMVEELLDLSKFISGKITVNNEKVNVTEIIDHVKMQLMPRAENEGIEFIVQCEDGLPVIEADANRLKQVFINVLDNAFKFTEASGKVVFTANRTSGKLCFSIMDTGCGIPAEELPRVKEKFYKGKNSNSKNGIGLSICDEIIKIMEGTLEIKSEVGKGTEVIIALPLHER